MPTTNPLLLGWVEPRSVLIAKSSLLCWGSSPKQSCRESALTTKLPQLSIPSRHLSNRAYGAIPTVYRPIALDDYCGQNHACLHNFPENVLQFMLAGSKLMREGNPRLKDTATAQTGKPARKPLRMPGSVCTLIIGYRQVFLPHGWSWRILIIPLHWCLSLAALLSSQSVCIVTSLHACSVNLFHGLRRPLFPNILLSSHGGFHQ